MFQPKTVDEIRGELISSLTDSMEQYVGQPNTAHTNRALQETMERNLDGMNMEYYSVEVTDSEDPDSVNVNLTMRPNLDFVETTIIVKDRIVVGHTIDENGNLIEVFKDG